MSKKTIDQYPWEKWFAEEELELRVGKDFGCAPYIMAQQFRNKAQMYTRDGKDLTVSIKIDGALLDIWIQEAE